MCQASETSYSDYGDQILSKLPPYHLINERRVATVIMRGTVPSQKPEYPHAAGCLNDSLWGVVRNCWTLDQRARPAAANVLNSLKGLIEQGVVSGASITPSPPTMDIDAGLVSWPNGIKELADVLAGYSKERISSRRTADIWV